MEAFSRDWSTDMLKDFIVEARQNLERQERGRAYEKSRSFFYSFSDFSERVIEVLKAAIPDGSEYAIALQLVALVFKVRQVESSGLCKLTATSA